MPKLALRRLAAENRSHYREHDEQRSLAHERALDGIRDGTGRNRAIRSGELPAYLTAVPIPGRREEDIIVWEIDRSGNEERAVILYLGPRNIPEH